MIFKAVYENNNFYIYKVYFTLFKFQLCHPHTVDGQPLMCSDLKTAIGLLQVMNDS